MMDEGTIPPTEKWRPDPPTVPHLGTVRRPLERSGGGKSPLARSPAPMPPQHGKYLKNLALEG